MKYPDNPDKDRGGSSYYCPRTDSKILYHLLIWYPIWTFLLAERIGLAEVGI